MAVTRIVCALVVFGVVAMISSSANAESPTCENPVGVWHNQLKSTLTITSMDKKTGQIAGTYVSPSGTAGEKHALVGWVNSAKPQAKGDNVHVIAFSVQWGTYGTVTSWSGYCSTKNGAPTITTIWHLVQPNSEFAWGHILTESDTFTPGAANK